MDTFGGKPTKGEGVFFVVFCAVIVFGFGVVVGLILCSM